MGRLQELRTLQLSVNQFNGSVPPEIGNLSQLEFLGLAYNAKFLPSTLPPSFRQLKKMKILWLTDENLIVGIPDMIEDMTALEVLDLSVNQLTGKIPNATFLLKNLRKIFIYKNKLSGEIPRVIKASNLTMIDLSGNNLTGTIPSDIGKLESLSSLVLFSNQLSGEIPQSIGRISTLTDVRLFSNNLPGTLPPDFGRYSMLEGFEVASNRLTGRLPENLCNGGKLGLVAFDNNLTGEIPHSLGNCSSLIMVDIRYNSLAGRIPTALWTSTSLSMLMLSDNSFIGELPEKVSHSLSRLEISNNKFYGQILVEVNSWKNLVVFKASNNQFNSTFPESLTALPSLTTLLLDQNKLHGSLPSDIISWKSLVLLNLGRNKLSGPIPEQIVVLPNLIDLDLLRNQFSVLVFEPSLVRIMTHPLAGVILLRLSVTGFVSTGRDATEDVLSLPSEVSRFSQHSDKDVIDGTRWAVLIAGSSGYSNYRHQADVCHAYQVPKKGGLKDENIVVFMYDDIAYHEDNPRPGVIINHPHGDDVYHGVPKDYTGRDLTVNNFLAAILGNKTAITGGSGKVVDSGPNDRIFIYYSDHGGAGILGMPNSEGLFADDLIEALKKKHALGTYKSLVFYLEACESGSIFEGLLPEGLNIYATTAANAEERSWAIYCPGYFPSPPPEYDTCLGDLYSVAWLEDSEMHDLRKKTLHQQYELVKSRTINDNSGYGSHVMQYGDIGLSKDNLFNYLGTNPANDYMGTNPANDYSTFVDDNFLQPPRQAVNQRDADLVHLWQKYLKAPDGSVKKTEAQKQFIETMSHRMHIDNSVKVIGKLLFGMERGSEVMNTVRSAGKPLVDDWKCLKKMVRTFETHCGSLSQYGFKHMRSLANICNAGIQIEQMAEASAQACVNVPSGAWSSTLKGFSA